MLFLLAFFMVCYAITCIFRNWRSRSLASPVSLYALLVIIHFAIPGMLIDLDAGVGFSYYKNMDYAIKAMLFIIASFLAFQSGNLFVNTFTRGLQYRIRNFSWKLERVLYYTIGIFSIGWIARIYIIQSNSYFQIMRTMQGELEGPFYAAIMMAEVFPMYAMCILAIVYWRPCLIPPRMLRLGFLFTLVCELIYWLPTGRKEPMILAILLPLLIRYLRKGILPSVKLVVILLSAMIALFPVTFIYRNAMETTGTDVDIIQTMVKASEYRQGGAVSDKNMSIGEIIFGRMSLLESVSASIRMIEDDIWELRLGSDYINVLLSFIPRVFWPDKPNFHYGNEFGYTAGFLSSEDLFTSISVTFFGEAFLNFSWGGVFPMFMLGAILSLLYRQIFVSVRQETWMLVYIVATPTVLYIGGTFALYFGGLIKLLPFFYILGRLMEYRSTRYSAATSPIAKEI